jgi:hypothetical protein
VELGREDDEDEEEEERPLETVGNIFARSVRFDSFQLWKRSTNYSTLISSFWCDVMSCDLCVSLSPSPVACYRIRNQNQMGNGQGLKCK